LVRRAPQLIHVVAVYESITAKPIEGYEFTGKASAIDE